MNITYVKTEFGYYEVRFGNAWSGYTVEKFDLQGKTYWGIHNCWASKDTSVLFSAGTLRECKEFIQTNFANLYAQNEAEHKRRSAINAELEAQKAAGRRDAVNGTLFDALALSQTSKLIEVAGDSLLSADARNRACNESYGVYACLAAYLLYCDKNLRGTDATTRCVADLRGFGAGGSYIKLAFSNRDVMKATLIIRITNQLISIQKIRHLNTSTLGIVQDNGTIEIASFSNPTYTIKQYVSELTRLLGDIVHIEY